MGKKVWRYLLYDLDLGDLGIVLKKCDFFLGDQCYQEEQIILIGILILI